jgi:hypothetical protein
LGEGDIGEELYPTKVLYSEKNIFYTMFKSRRVRWARQAACVGKKRNVYRILVGKPEGKRQL